MSFNWLIYKKLNPDLEAAGLKTQTEIVKHYNMFGIKEKRNCNVYDVYRDFDWKQYQINYSDLSHMNRSELETHWIIHGVHERRSYYILEPFKYIDKIIYINLDKRIDRKLEIEEQFRRVNVPSDKIIRLSAVYDNPGYLGCSQSHIKCLEYAIENNLSNVLILEDDFNFIDTKKALHSSLQNIKDINNWDVIFFSASVNEKRNYNSFLDKAIDVQTASGYLVNSNYFNTLLNNFKEGLNLLRNTDIYSKYALDQHWKLLQQKDNWYIFKTILGYQRESFSNIEGKVVKYNC